MIVINLVFAISFWTFKHVVPRNVILDSAFCAKLADFGSGRVAGWSYGVRWNDLGHRGVILTCNRYVGRGKSMIFLNYAIQEDSNMNDFHIFSHDSWML